MEILPYEPSLLSELTAFYNRVVSGVPHCSSVGEEEFARAVAAAIGEGLKHSRLHSEAVFVAREGGAVSGFVHSAVGSLLVDGTDPRGSLRFIGYERGRRAAGQALLETADRYLRGQEMTRIEAFASIDTYRFYHVGWAGLSHHLDHVSSLLRVNGQVQIAVRDPKLINR